MRNDDGNEMLRSTGKTGGKFWLTGAIRRLAGKETIEQKLDMSLAPLVAKTRNCFKEYLPMNNGERHG